MGEAAPLATPLPREVPGGWLTLVLWDEDRLDEVQALVRRSQPTLAEFLPWANEPVTEDAERAALDSSLQRWREGSMAGWVILEDGRALGMLGLHRRGGPDELEIGYWLDDGATGRGVMTEAARMATEVAFSTDGIDAVEITHDAANLRSGAVPARLGYRRVAAWTSTASAPKESGIKVRWVIRRDEWSRRQAATTPAPLLAAPAR